MSRLYACARPHGAPQGATAAAGGAAVLPPLGRAPGRGGSGPRAAPLGSRRRPAGHSARSPPRIAPQATLPARPRGFSRLRRARRFRQRGPRVRGDQGGASEPCGPFPGHGGWIPAARLCSGSEWGAGGMGGSRPSPPLPFLPRSRFPWQSARAVQPCPLPAVLPAAPAPGRAHHTLLCGCCLTRLTAKMELLLYKKLIKRRT